MPNNLRVSILVATNVDNRILRVRLEGIPIIIAERDICGLQSSGCSGSVKCNDTIVLIGEHAARVVAVHDCRATIHLGCLVERPECDLLVSSVVEIVGCCVAPVLVFVAVSILCSSYRSRRREAYYQLPVPVGCTDSTNAMYLESPSIYADLTVRRLLNVPSGPLCMPFGSFTAWISFGSVADFCMNVLKFCGGLKWT